MSSLQKTPEPFLDTAKSLACVHCGLCLSSCPTYLETGNENDSPRGRIYLMRALQEGRLPMSDQPVRHIDLCLGCRACEAACPSGVEYGELLEYARDHIETHHRRSVFQRLLRRVAIERLFPFPNRMKLALLPVRLIRALGLERRLPVSLRELTSLVPREGREVKLPEVTPARKAPARGRIGFIRGCVMSVMFGDTNASSVRLIAEAGFDVVTPRAQECCGALYAHTGRLNLARESARRNIEAFERENLDAIIINAAGCGSTLKEYDKLLARDAEWSERARSFSSKVKDLTEWLTLDGLSHPGRGIATRRVTYHDACHLAHAQRITSPPRELVRAMAGDQFVELPESDVCCGSAGSYNLTEPEMAARLQRRKIDRILNTGAEVVVTTNPGCILQIQSGLRKAGADQVEVLHIADYLLRARGNE